MANSSTNFIKINNEYVKFYATTNSALPEILRNTGALIVVQKDKLDETNDYLRSLYLAYNFIAEGHGFSSYTVRDYYDSYGSIESNGQRKLTNILNNLGQGIQYNSEQMNYYVLIHGGDISETQIGAYIEGSNDRTPITSKYLTNLLKPAEYDDIYIHDVTSYIEYKYYNQYENNKYVTISEIAYASNIDTIDFNDRTITRDIIYNIPRGAEIQYAYLSMNTENNSCASFNADQADNNSEIIPAEASSLFISYIDTSTHSNRYIYNKETSDNFRNYTYFTGHTFGTVNYKKYPNMPQEIDYISYENAIGEYTLNIGYIKCNIYDTIKYGIVSDDSTIKPSYIYGTSHNARIYDINNRYSYAIIKFDDIEDNSYITFAIPMNYDIVRGIQSRKYTSNNREANYEYNITGDIHELTYDMNQQSSYVSLISSNIDNTKQYQYVKNYVLTNNINSGDSLLLSLLNNGDNESFIIEESISNYDSNNDELTKTSYFVQNSEYNSTHWFAPSELSYIQNII